jgi:hypothetical protein
VFDESFEDMPRRVPDISKIRQFVGYSPTVHLDEIIENVVEYWMTDRNAQVARLSTGERERTAAAHQATSLGPADLVPVCSI